MAAAASAAAAAGGPEHASGVNLATLREDPHTGRIREWQPIWSGQAGVYWHNTHTNETQWETPALVTAYWAYRERERAQRSQPPPPARGPPQRPPVPPPSGAAPASDAVKAAPERVEGEISTMAAGQGEETREMGQEPSDEGHPTGPSPDDDSTRTGGHASDEEGCVVEPPESGDEDEAPGAGGADAWEARDTDDGEVYYYNTMTGETRWEVPDVLLAMPDSEGEEDEETGAGPAGDADAAQGDEQSGGHAANGDGEGSDEGEEVAASGEAHDDAGTAPADARCAAEDAATARRERAVQLIHGAFEALLRKRGVGPFAQWSTWLPRLVAEPRFRAVPTMSERHDLFRQFVKAQRGEAGRRRRQGRERAAALLREALHKSGVESRLTRDTPVEKTLSLVQGSGVADAADCLQQAFQLVGDQGAMGKLLQQGVLSAVEERERKAAEEAEASKPGSSQRKRARNAARAAAAAVLEGDSGETEPRGPTMSAGGAAAPAKRRRAHASHPSDSQAGSIAAATTVGSGNAGSQNGADGLSNEGERRFCDLVREVGSRAGWSRDTPWSAVARSLLRSDPRYEEVEDRKRRKELFEQVTADMEGRRVDEGQRKQLLSVYERKVFLRGEGERAPFVEDAHQPGARGGWDRALEAAQANQRERELFGRRADG